jgi:hypothetical protein
VDGFVKPSELRDFAVMHFPYVDPFILDEKRAVSCMNESHVAADSKQQIIERLQAVEFWTRDDGVIDKADVDFEQKLAIGMDFRPTVLPNIHVVEEARRVVLAHARANSMPTHPYVGENALEVAEFLADLLRRLIPRAGDLRGAARWAAKPTSEYDFQGLFWITAKPWLPSLAREEVAIEYDGQKKKADFNFADNQIVLEMKHIKDANTMAAVGKTLRGLGEFYRTHVNIRVALFAVLVEQGVALDGPRWEQDFSFLSARPQVKTVIVRNQAGY